MSEKPKENNTKKGETGEELSFLKPGEDFSSPEGPSSDFSDIRCPLCPKFAKITINHLKNEIISECPDNHYMKLDFLSFLEKSTDHPLDSTKCSICNSAVHTDNYCLECNKYFCNECLEKHNKNELPSSNAGAHSNISLRANTSENNNSDMQNENNNNNSVPTHLKTLNSVITNNSSLNTNQHHVIDIKEKDNHCPIHNREKFSALCLKCNKSFCEKCLDEINKKLPNNLSAISCVKLGNFAHTIKKMKDLVGEEKLKKIKQNLDKESEVLNYIENQSNLIIEQILEKINNLREIHLLKEELYNLFLKNQENASLVKTMNELESSGFKLQPEIFNTSEKLLKNLEIIDIKLPKDKIPNIIDEEKRREIIQNKINKKNELKKLKEEKQKKVQQMKEAKKEELKKKKEQLRRQKEQKKKQLQKLKEEKKKQKDNKDNGKEGEIEKEDIKEDDKEVEIEQNSSLENKNNENK